MENLRLPMDGEEVEFDREHAFVYEYLGKCALGLPLSTYNHIFLAYQEECKDAMTGAYLFSYEEKYEEIVEFMVENDYPQHLKLPWVDAQCIDIFDWYNEADSHIPTDWSD